MPRGNAENLRTAARRKNARAAERVERAIKALVKDGQPISFATVADRAGCSRDYLYANQDFRRRIEHLRDQQQRTGRSVTAASARGTSDSVVRVLTAQLTELKRRHREEIAELRRALESAQGEVLELRRRLRDGS